MSLSLFPNNTLKLPHLPRPFVTKVHRTLTLFLGPGTLNTFVGCYSDRVQANQSTRLQTSRNERRKWKADLQQQINEIGFRSDVESEADDTVSDVRYELEVERLKNKQLDKHLKEAVAANRAMHAGIKVINSQQTEEERGKNQKVNVTLTTKPPQSDARIEKN